MNGCGPIREQFTDYLDGRLTGHEMQDVAAHLENCGNCAAEWTLMRRVQASLASIGPVKEPGDLLLRIRVALSHERARARQSRLQVFNLAWKNTIGPFLLQAGAGLASAMLFIGTVTVLVTVFAQPQRVNAMDEPLGNATGPRLVYLTPGAETNEIDAGPVVVEAYVNGDGRVYDFRIVSGPSDAATRSQIENILVDSYFEPARFFGEPVRGLAVLSFAGVSVRG